MQLQGRKLASGTRGDDVRLLHRELRLLGFRQIPDREIQLGFFGPVTFAAVRDFQKRFGLDVSGVVEEITARAINREVDKITGGATDNPDRMVRGHVRRADGQPIVDGQVRAFHVDGTVRLPLGEQPIDVPGDYTIRYASPPGIGVVNLRVVLLDQTGKQLQSSEIIAQASALESIDLIVPASEQQGARVFGTVRDELGEPLANAPVQAFDRDLRSEQLLGDARTSSQGRYEIRYDGSQFRKAEKQSADLVVKVLDGDGRELHKTSIHFNVPDDFELDITLKGAVYKGPSEWESLSKSLTPLLEDLSPLDVREDDQLQDISFLAEETGNDRLTIGAWIFSFRLADKTEKETTPLSPEVLFGFLRQGQPAIFYESILQDIRHSDRVTLLEDKILRELAAIIPDVQESLLDRAIAENIIPARIAPQIPAALATLERIKLRYAAEVTFGGGKGTIGQLLAITPAAKQQQATFLTALNAHPGPLGTFWKKLEEDKVLPPEAIQQVKLSFELGALTRNHIPLVAAIVDDFQKGDIKAKRELAKLSRSDWKRVFERPGRDGKPIGVPANLEEETADAGAEQFAAFLEQQFERTYPTTSFAAKLNRAEVSPVKAKTGVVRFLDRNPQFHLDRFRIDHFIAEHQEALEGIENKETVVAEIKSVQRVFKLSPTFVTVNVLLSHNIDSAQQIYFMGQAQFTKAVGDSGINKIEAKKVYRRAASSYATALALFADHNFALNGVAPFAMSRFAPDADTQAKIAALPNLQTLFGSLDYCECTHCRSVYSPAAYFVDVMRFLGLRGTQGTGVNAGKNVRQVLLERRPDLGEIELSCENTNTPLPYIDLVNEILEEIVSPPLPVALNAAIEADLVAGTIRQPVFDDLTAKGIAISLDAHLYAPDSRGHWAIRDTQHAYKIFKSGADLRLLPTRQTFSSAAELRANPEHTNENAYSKLEQEVFPFNLPFDLWYLQTRTYLDHLGLPLPRLLEIFQQKLADDVTLFPSELQIDSAWLHITDTERAILNGSLAGKQPWDYWGLAENANNIPNPEKPADPTENVTGTWIQVLGSVNVILNRAGLSYKELLQLLDMRYVNLDGSIDIFDTSDANSANCDTSKFTVKNLTADRLTRMHRFIRLWRKLGCAMWELDMLLPDTNPAANIIDKQITDAVLQDLSRMNRLREELSLDWRVVYSLYNDIDHDVYVEYAKDGAAVQTLYQRLFRNKLVDAVASFPPTPGQITGTIETHVPGILAAFRIKELDLTLILTDLGLATANNLDVTILSRIYRITALAKTIGLTIDAFLRLKRLWAQDPFANPAATRKFITLAKKIAASGFSVAELDYLLAHRFPAGSGVAIEDKTIAAVARAIREGLQKISDDIRLKTEETKEAYVKSKLGLLPALGKDSDQTLALSIIDGAFQGTPAERNTLIDAFFADVLDLVVAKTKLGPLPGGLSAAALQAEVDKRFDYVQPELELFLLRTQKDNFIREKIAEVLQLDVPTTGAMLTSLRLPSATDTLLQNINDARLLDRLADGTYLFALDETSFPALFKTLRLLHKNALMIAKLQMKATDVAWWLDGTRAADMGWMHPKDFPIDTTAQVVVARWVAIQQFFAWRAGLPKSDITAIEFATNVLDDATLSSANIADLAKLTSWEPSDINALAIAFHWVDPAAAFDVIKQQLRESASLVRLAEAMRALRRLGVNAARAIQWSKGDPGSAEADSLKQTVKAKYDLPQWRQVIQPIQDIFREHKRHALVSWLIAHPDQAQGQSWSDANGLYSYFLIDVEMSACMLTSRLKQAAASAQLFVQRCLLNLEVDILAKTDLDPKWKQWKWMRRYRVWEANRKVFLYPENWIEPELRDEKSPFFKELESELMQNDVTNETAEQAFLNYLEKLDAVANLEIRAMYNQTISDTESVLHVIGRSRSSQAPQYYYRQRINGARWKAWEKVDLDINAQHVLFGVDRRRLFLLWPQFLLKGTAPPTVITPNPNTSTPIVQPTRYWEVRLFWSEWKKGKWTPKVLSDSPIVVYQSTVGGDRTDNVEFRTRLAPNIQVRLYLSTNSGINAPLSDYLFDKLGKNITAEFTSTVESIISATDSRYQNNLIAHTTSSQYFYYDAVTESGKGHTLAAHHNAVAIRLLKNIRPNLTFSVIDSRAASFAGDGSFFVWDPLRTYFVDYTHRTDWSYFSRAWHAKRVSSFRFFTHYHPFVDLFIKELNMWGIGGLLNRRIQVDPASIPGGSAPFNFADYQPEAAVVATPHPGEDVDFSYIGAYSSYNWELFFHAPFYIANKLSANQRFEEALEWFHYIFDPTSTDTATASPDTPQQKFWIAKPFYETTKADYYKQKIETIMLAIAKGDAELRAQVEEWRNNPFNPHLIARMRTVAYQKNLLIKYIQTLIAWADQLFRQDTIESINEATQLYILSASVLGPRPKSIPRKIANPVKTFYQLQQDGIDVFGNVLKEVENLIPTGPPSGMSDDDAPELPHLDVLYFCIPNNEKLLTLWDMVADRLFKIRHCMNIEGVVRQLPLFEPPIDPAMLVRAAAAGLDIGAVLSDMSAPLPLYRFTFMIQRALEMCNELRNFGNAMLTALEKRDADGFALLRSSHEQILLAQVRLIKNHQIDEALRSKEALDESRKVVEERRTYYETLVRNGLNGWEVASLAMTGGAIVAEVVATVLNALGTGTSLIPEVTAGASGFGGSPHLAVSLGGKSVTSGLTKAAEVTKGIANILQMAAGMTATIANHNRRAEDWGFQLRLSEKELPQIDKQIVAATIRHQIAIQELVNQDTQIENAQKQDEYLRTKFTNLELYDWMIGQLSEVYFQSYQLAYDVAKRAERSFRYELGLTDSSYIAFGYWDSLKKGLLSGERLMVDLRRLEAAYYEQNRREYELTKHISLGQLDPVALLKLRQNGDCFVDIPETAFDMDYPGHYFRRIKSVALSIPCTAGPYTTVACTLTLTSNHLRKDSTLLGGTTYARDLAADDPRFRDEIAAIQSVATSNAQNDRGMFELNFRDERYLPFEGAGAVSTWHIKLNEQFPLIDLSTISDVILHMDYTAREGGDLLRSKAVEEFNKKMNDLALAESRRGLFRMFDLKREYPDKWYRFLHPANPADDQSILLDDLTQRLPYFTGAFPTKKATKIEVVAQMKDGADYKVLLSPLGNAPADLLALAPDPTYEGLHRAFKDLTGSEINFGAWMLKIQPSGAADFKSLSADAIEELFLILNYTIA
jgi:hypothetical protein